MRRHPSLMLVSPRALLDLHARAFNSHDVETMARSMDRTASLYCDGLLVAEGPDGARRVVEEEYAKHSAAAGTIVELDSGERVLVEWSDAERGGEAVGVMRYLSDGDTVQSLRIEHDPEQVRRLIASGRRKREARWASNPWSEAA